jgi:Endosomal/lysosomal potassium channel TMEM175
MFRKHLISSQTSGEPGFHWRGAEVTRLEGFTDAVFAFAVTLLVVSLEVPKTFPELLVAMHGFLAFGVCFALHNRAFDFRSSRTTASIAVMAYVNASVKNTSLKAVVMSPEIRNNLSGHGISHGSRAVQRRDFSHSNRIPAPFSHTDN